MSAQPDWRETPIPDSPLPIGEQERRGSTQPEEVARSIPGIESLRRHLVDLQSQNFLPTDIPELDRILYGGLPRGKLIEITGSPSSGKTSFLFSLLSRITTQEEFAAYVDAFDCFDPESATRAGINLSRMLWVRCRQEGDTGEIASGKALKAMDILSQAGGFGLIVLDLQPFGTIRGWHVPLQAWFRLQRALAGTLTVAVVLSQYRTVGSAAALSLSMERGQSLWSHPFSRSTTIGYGVENSGLPPDGHDVPESGLNRLQGLHSEARLLKGNPHGAVPIFCRF